MKQFAPVWMAPVSHASGSLKQGGGFPAAPAPHATFTAGAAPEYARATPGSAVVISAVAGPVAEGVVGVAEGRNSDGSRKGLQQPGHAGSTLSERDGGGVVGGLARLGRRS